MSPVRGFLLWLFDEMESTRNAAQPIKNRMMGVFTKRVSFELGRCLLPALAAMKLIVAHQPFVAAVERPQFFARHEKHAPALDHALGFFG